ncbi:hypothetical protein LIER_27805 [Lithospermum erythrorhizon]|uniref:Uncharacterized protein n=1 Tax=Lithospermum erythrorhizon TaxID=34254 RepID=A0AAV3RDC9_LITER
MAEAIITTVSSSTNTTLCILGKSSDHNLKIQLDLLLKSEEEYWCQISKLTTISEGDRNTKFFHAHARQKVKINNILEIMDSNHNMITKEEDIRAQYRSYYMDLFNPIIPPSQVQANDHFPVFESLKHITSKLTPPQISCLSAPFKPEEVKTVLFQMLDYKSPWPDRFPAEFYKKIGILSGRMLHWPPLNFSIAVTS